MTENKTNHKTDAHPGDFPRRDFVALSVTAGLAATAGSASAALRKTPVAKSETQMSDTRQIPLLPATIKVEHLPQSVAPSSSACS